ncbi:hypothetical protein I350_04397 [Cryptococcus amylolentus CBS 6273]|uniref:SGNH hydrolase-type esterase domain-containing protein n=1 Tax=Cryptococcus amylolentus CBS 6273 TaxID=1296118 RepID=A0A1E3K1W2_9TREE|nr:hypothetical protein I350_04397 [Cryptococcus amylolentus CBS 6273]
MVLLVAHLPRHIAVKVVAISMMFILFIMIPWMPSNQGAHESDLWRALGQGKGIGSLFSRLDAQAAVGFYHPSGEDVSRRPTPTAAARGCSMCEMDPALCEELGKSNIERSLVYSGTGLRLRRMASKLKRGGRLVHAIIGGSVSTGTNIDKDPSYGGREQQYTNFNRIIFDRLNSLFPAPNGTVIGKNGREEGKNSMINGAQGGTGSAYFSLCWGEHIPTDVDLVTIDSAVNDVPQLVTSVNSYETLARSLLELPSHPALLNMQVFSVGQHSMVNGGDMHIGVASWYDIPSISQRNALHHTVLKNASLVPELFSIGHDGKIDLRHASIKGHNILGRLGAAYVESQVCEMEKYEASIPNAAEMTLDQLYPVEPLPRMQLNHGYEEDFVLPPIRPQCFSTNSVKHPLVPIAARSDLGSEAWHPWAWQNKKYLITNTTGTKVQFQLETGSGHIGIQYQRSPTYGLGSVKCWVDGSEHQAVKVHGYWERPHHLSQPATVKDGLKPGKHLLTCQLLDETQDPNGGKEFRLIAVTAA